MELLRFLKENKDSRKLFGKKEIEIIEKQLLGINLTQSEKNRLSRDIRKKLEFIKEASAFSDEFKLKKASEIKRIIEETKSLIIEDKLFKKIKKITLFGSAAENALTFRSDVDIAVEFDDISREDATKFRLRILRGSNKKVDIQVYNLLPEKIKKEIDKKGKILQGKNE